MVLNMISTGSMVGIGKVYQNLMVDVVQTNMKLITRAENIVMTATECTREEARNCLEAVSYTHLDVYKRQQYLCIGV